MSGRDLARMTWMEIRDLEKQQGAVVLPLGSLEQHGPHLSVDTDLFFADRFLDLALARLPDEARVWRLPILPISRSIEHVGFPGSLWLTTATLLTMVGEIAEGVAKSAFRRLVLLNCHGGNVALLEVAARDVRVATGLMTFTLFPPGLVPDPVEVTPQEQTYGIHANDWETSVMLALSPERVRPDLLDRSYPGFRSEHLKLEFSAANVAWVSKDLTSTGTFGDAQEATAERGHARLEPLLDRLAAVLAEISRFEMPEAPG